MSVPKSAEERGPSYYHKGIQPTHYIVANLLGWHEGNVIKYITRWREKDGVRDLQKAKHYIELLIESVERGDMEPYNKDKRDVHNAIIRRRQNAKKIKTQNERSKGKK